MLTLATTGDYLLMVLIAALGGLVGGLAAELLLSRDGQTGAFELPGRRTGLFDLGGFATLVVGAVAGVAILLVLPATNTVVTTAADGSTTTAASFDLVRLVATTLVAGSAGGSVLTALQSRVTAAINEARVEFVRATGQEQVDRVRDAAVRQLGAMAESRGTAPAGARSRSIGAGAPAGAAAISADDLAAATREIDAAADSGRRAVERAADVDPRRRPRAD
jgi:hypothetical protein